jgi:hypothetical protein
MDPDQQGDTTRYFFGRPKKVLMAETFSDSSNRKNQLQERIRNWRKCVQNWREHILLSEKQNSDENSGVQKVRNRINCGIPWNSKRISQPSSKKI